MFCYLFSSALFYITKLYIYLRSKGSLCVVGLPTQLLRISKGFIFQLVSEHSLSTRSYKRRVLFRVLDSLGL
jgi:hypothetical protein